MIEIIRGSNEKPVSTEELVDALSEKLKDSEGLIYIGYPIIATSLGSATLDVVLVTPEHGMVIFDVIEGTGIGKDNNSEVRDEIYLNATSRLLQTKELTKNRKLEVGVNVATYAPAVSQLDDSEIFHDKSSVNAFLDEIADIDKNSSYFLNLKSAIQAVTKLRASNRRRDIKKTDSRGAKLKAIEDSIAHLDSKQNRAVIETVEGPQRIRGLAGSGKTVILALKAAYLHSAYPDWNIAVTYNTRSLHGQFKDLITKFTIEQKGEEPDWEKLKIVQAWGSSRSTGIYYEFCQANDITYYDFRSASFRLSRAHPFARACKNALEEASKRSYIKTNYDAILIDEAQDFAYPFLQLCYAFLPKPKRLVWAYDELQNLEQMRMPSPKELFGVDLTNEPDAPKEDIILERCYRNPGPVLVTAHALGFGVERKEGLIQMFDSPSLWSEIGYKVIDGALEKGKKVVLARDKETSPDFLENHSNIDDLIIFKSFKSLDEQADWITSEIEKNLNDDELRRRDIVVISLDARKLKEDTALIRAKLYDKQISCHIPGDTTSPDVFFQDESIAFTSIYRAKGNEAPMIYIVDGEVVAEGSELISKRNKLFSAITRSKAWVRVTGIGEGMDALKEEFEKIKQKQFRIEMQLPTDEEMEKLRVINRDLTKTEIKEREVIGKNLEFLVKKLKSGEIRPEEIGGLEQLKIILDEQKS